MIASSPDRFGTPSEKVGTLNHQKDSQERSRAVKRLYRLDTFDNIEKANNQGVGL